MIHQVIQFIFRQPAGSRHTFDLDLCPRRRKIRVEPTTGVRDQFGRNVFLFYPRIVHQKTVDMGFYILQVVGVRRPLVAARAGIGLIARRRWPAPEIAVLREGLPLKGVSYHLGACQYRLSFAMVWRGLGNAPYQQTVYTTEE